MMTDKALIIFTRLPIAGHTKTRLQKSLTAEEIAKLHQAFILDAYKTCLESGQNIYFYYTPPEEASLAEELIREIEGKLSQGREMRSRIQKGQGLGDRMYQAMKEVLTMGYKSVILLGTDIPLLGVQDIDYAWQLLDEHDLVLGPTLDGGYYLVGMNEVRPEIFDMTYSHDQVLADTVERAKGLGLRVGLGNRQRDIDNGLDLLYLIDQDRAGLTPQYTSQVLEDLGLLEENSLHKGIIEKIAKSENLRKALGLEQSDQLDFSFLGQGEYNINYSFTDPRQGRDLVLRINTGSQMHLDNQIKYEYQALELLEATGRTPRVVYLDDSRSLVDYGIMVMEFLPGRPLVYETDMLIAAEIIAHIHACPLPCDHHLIAPDDPLAAVLEESIGLAQVYLNDESYARPEVKDRIRELIKSSQALYERNKQKKLDQSSDDKLPKNPSSKIANKSSSRKRSIINTELNSGNFLINPVGETSYLIDWEKPLYAYPEQDLGHFLAPTTTNWKTDTLLTMEEMQEFVASYHAIYSELVHDSISLAELWHATHTYIMMTCLRGISWSAMAWIDYQNPDKLIHNQETYDKICSYLEPAYLDNLIENYLS